MDNDEELHEELKQIMNNEDKDHTVDTPKLGRRNSKTPTSINISII